MPASCWTSVPAPYVLTANPEDVTELEALMRRSVAVVAYSCGEVKPLKECRVPGEYSFAGSQPKSSKTQLHSEQDAETMFPGWGVTPGLRLRAGESADVDLVTVGELRANLDRVARGDLQGQCEGATHVVRGATIGAFAVALKGASSRTASRQEGDPGACASGAQLRAQCRSLARLDLLPIQ
jgi:hypothetical protein